MKDRTARAGAIAPADPGSVDLQIQQNEADTNPPSREELERQRQLAALDAADRAQIAQMEDQLVALRYLSNAGDAERLIFKHHEDIRWVSDAGQWMVWDGKRWVLDLKERRMLFLAYQTARELRRHPDAETKAMKAWIPSAESTAGMRNAIQAAASIIGSRYPECVTRVEDFDAKPRLLNFQNGTLDLRWGILHEHNRDDLLTKIAPVRFDRRAKCPHWDEFTSFICCHDTQLRDYLQEGIGASATGFIADESLFILHGPTGANGKTTLAKMLMRTLGEYTATTPIQSLLEDKSGPIRNDLARLRGARIVFANEPNKGAKLDETGVKTITGDDRITCRFLRQEYFEYDPSFNIWMLANNRPEFSGDDTAMWRRIQCLPFRAKFVGEDPMEKLDSEDIEHSSSRLAKDEVMARFQAEIEGIAAWIVRGSVSYLRRKRLPECTAVVQEKLSYRFGDANAKTFLKECTEVVHGPEAEKAWIPKNLSYSRYMEWAHFIGRPAMSRDAFFKEMKAHVKEKRTSTQRYWMGVRWKEEKIQQIETFAETGI